jgi:hypothetical protein
MRPSRNVRLSVYPNTRSAVLQTPQGTFNLKYIGIKLGGSHYNIVGSKPVQNMIFIERYAGATEYDVYYERPGVANMAEETWIPAYQ